ncbi:putative membrane protein [Nocardia nova SH22a]|uniref:Putative membrane protein n=1 Tax=Nocardia nova SH22a TaxID=1415166 RepID=W5TH83_9NOCA|nr:hypothetical protein [Nocardia nova]AHH16601.1 putative membrane protein [Nocardia nova SH22a]
MKRFVVLIAAALAGLLALYVAPDRETVGNSILAALAVVSWLFVAVYGLRSQWRATASGRAIMRLVMCIGLICTQGITAVLTDFGYPGRDIIRPLLLLGVAVAVLDLLITLVRIQRQERTPRED